LAGRFALAVLVLLIASGGDCYACSWSPGLFLFMPFDLRLGGRDQSPLPGVRHVYRGFLTVAQFSFWGNYLPRVLPLHLRGTAKFAAISGAA